MVQAVAFTVDPDDLLLCANVLSALRRNNVREQSLQTIMAEEVAETLAALCPLRSQIAQLVQNRQHILFVARGSSNTDLPSKSVYIKVAAAEQINVADAVASYPGGPATIASGPRCCWPASQPRELLTSVATMRDWQRSTLGEIAQVVGGGTPPTKVGSYWGRDITWLTPTEALAEAAFTTGQLQRMLPKGSTPGIRHALQRLVEQGIVEAEQVGRAWQCRLNREHLAAGPVIALANLRRALLQRMEDELEGWNPRPCTQHCSALRHAGTCVPTPTSTSSTA